MAEKLTGAQQRRLNEYQRQVRLEDGHTVNVSVRGHGFELRIPSRVQVRPGAAFGQRSLGGQRVLPAPMSIYGPQNIGELVVEGEGGWTYRQNIRFTDDGTVEIRETAGLKDSNLTRQGTSGKKVADPNLVFVRLSEQGLEVTLPEGFAASPNNFEGAYRAVNCTYLKVGRGATVPVTQAAALEL